MDELAHFAQWHMQMNKKLQVAVSYQKDCVILSIFSYYILEVKSCHAICQWNTQQGTWDLEGMIIKAVLSKPEVIIAFPFS